jgi:hypothetical protein
MRPDATDPTITIEPETVTINGFLVNQDYSYDDDRCMMITTTDPPHERGRALRGG